MHRAWWRVSPLKKVRACRRWSSEPGDELLPLRGSEAPDGTLTVGIGGTKTCATWHSCLGGCSAKIAKHRADELDHALRVWQALGGSVVMATFSVRHHKGQRLRELIEMQRAGRAAVVSDRPWKRERELLGIRWVLWAFECTHGDEHGFHPHLHVLLLCDPREWETTRVPWGDKGQTREQLVRPIGDPIAVSSTFAESVLTGAWSRWCEGIATRGGSAVAYVLRGGERESAGFDVTVMQTNAREAFGQYPYKMALEAVGALWKHGREQLGQRHRTPFEVMTHYAVAAREGDEETAAADLAIVSEWSQTMTDLRVRQCAWPPGMRAWFAEQASHLDVDGPLLEPELTEEEIADRDEPGSETLGYVRPGEWSSTIAYELDTLRTAARTAGMVGVVAWFSARGLVLELAEAGQARYPEALVVAAAGDRPPPG